MTNQDHGDQLISEAADIASRRRALLAAACCLTTTKTLSGAITALQAWDGPDQIRIGALAILDAITETR